MIADIYLGIIVGFLWGFAFTLTIWICVDFDKKGAEK